jgi:hypothetical protein
VFHVSFAMPSIFTGRIVIRMEGDSNENRCDQIKMMMGVSGSWPSCYCIKSSVKRLLQRRERRQDRVPGQDVSWAECAIYR